ncbi:MAG: hypothetical protein JW384_03869 [Nitrosomonadaceae bacterium]|nr:hypothetical protein [Nitrosomonadaceae bacterium]
MLFQKNDYVHVDNYLAHKEEGWRIQSVENHSHSLYVEGWSGASYCVPSKGAVLVSRELKAGDMVSSRNNVQIGKIVAVYDGRAWVVDNTRNADMKHCLARLEDLIPTDRG